MDNKYTKIPNNVLEALIGAGLNGTEMATALFVFRKTIGWNKESDNIALSQFEESIGATRPTICKALKTLLLVKILLLVKKGNQSHLASEYSFSLNIEKWKLVKKPLLVKKMTITSKEIEIELVKKPLPTKDTSTKDNTKDKETLEKIRLHWNGFKSRDKNWKGTRTVSDDLIKAYIKIRKKQTDEEFSNNWNHAIDKYLEEIKKRSDDSGYYNHRFTLSEFMGRDKGYKKFVNID